MSGKDVDKLYHHANRLMMSKPGTQSTIEAAERAAEAAGALLALSETTDNRRRLARALWRQSCAYLVAGNVPPAAVYAGLCWTQCRQLLADTAADAAAFDEIAGLVIYWCGNLGPALVAAGFQQDADQMMEAMDDIAARAQGPRGLQARARIAMGKLSIRADIFLHGDLDVRADPVAEEVRQAVDLGRVSVTVLRKHVAEGPYEATDLAVMLEVLSRLYLAAGLLEDIGPTLDEAISVAAPLARRGPAFARLLQKLRDEREAVREVGKMAGMLLTAGTERAFLRVARDLGDDSGDLFPGEVYEAVALIADLRSQEAADPDYLGPLLGLAMAWLARLLRNAGAAAEAGEVAGQAARQLQRFNNDAPDHIQAALVVALVVAATAQRAAGAAQESQWARISAATKLTVLLHHDPTYADDLGTPWRLR